MRTVTLKQIRSYRPGAGVLFMSLAALLWAVAELLVGLLPHGVTVPVIVAIRYTVHLVALMLLTGGRSGPLYATRRPLLQIGRGLLMLGMPLSSVVAVALAPVNTVWAVFWVMPLLVVGLAGLLPGERVGRTGWLAALLGSAGALLMIQPTAAGLSRAVLPALAMAFCFSLYLVLTRMLRSEHTTSNLFYTGASVLVPLLLAAPLYWQMPPPAAWPILIAIGLVGLAALYAFDRACEAESLARLTPILCIQPVVLVAAANLFSGSPPGRKVLAGAAAVIAAIVLVELGQGAHMPVGEEHTAKSGLTG